jgi:hypothetical protein
MRFEEVDWESGEVVFWDLGSLDPSRPLVDQVEDLKEDLVQVRYGLVTLDVGWYPEFSSEGEFVVRVVRDANWDKPLLVESSKTVDGLLTCIRRALAVAKSNKS